MSSKKHIICYRCYFHSGQCFCDELVEVPTNIRFTIIMHHREYHLSSNTGRLARNTLPNCKIILRGLEGESINWNEVINKNEDTYILYPSPDSIEATPHNLLSKNSNKKIHIIVPDGSWKQASKVYKREAALKNIPCIKLPEKNYISNYHLRKAPQENYLCTYEAMSKVVEELESHDFSAMMQKNLEILVNVSFKNRKHCLPAFSKGTL
jgi:DTW domain-containing protein YfiP